MSSETKRIEIIQYLRGLASLAVAWFHLTNQWKDGVRVSGSYGWLGVEAFFVISGFVIPYSISLNYKRYSASAFVSFMSRRVLRIEVPYIVSMILTMTLGYLSAMAPSFKGSVPHYTLAQITSNIFYVATLTGETWIQPVYWTLAFEFAFYLIIGLLFGVLFKDKLTLAYLLAVGVLVLLASQGWISILVLLFVMGSAIFRQTANLDHRLVTVLIVSVCTVTIGVVGDVPTALTGLVTSAIIGFGQGIHVKGNLGKVLSYLGTVSYSLYLIHVPIGGRVINLTARFVHGELEHLCASGLALVITLVFAHVFYIGVERPSQRRARNFVHLRRISLVNS